MSLFQCRGGGEFFGIQHKFFLKSAIFIVLYFFIRFFAWATEPHVDANSFHWTKEKSEFANISVEVAGPGTIQNFIQATGKVIMHSDNLAYVIPKVTGSVSEIRKNLGDSVEKDEIIALIESKEIAEAKANYLAALTQFNLRQILLDKEKILIGISPEEDYLNAEFAVAEATIYLQYAIQQLCAFGLTIQEIDNIEKSCPSKMRFYEIKSPISGRILERNLTLGEIVGIPNKVFTICNLDKVCIAINVPQNDVCYLKENLPLEVMAHGKKASLKISQFNPLISEETRTATAIALMDNVSNKWSPGEFVTAHLLTDAVQADVVVPLTALQMIKGQQCVFVENGHEFIPCFVKLGRMDRQNAEIISGLEPGISYAAQNTFCLKAEYEKEEIEHNH